MLLVGTIVGAVAVVVSLMLLVVFYDNDDVTLFSTIGVIVGACTVGICWTLDHCRDIIDAYIGIANW